MIMLRNLDKSWKVSTNLKNLNKSWKSRQSRWKSWCSQVSIEKSLFKKSRQRKKIVVSTLSIVSISISLGIDCQDPSGLEKKHFGLTEIWSSSPFACKFNTFYLKNCCFTKPIKKQKKTNFLENWFFPKKIIFYKKRVKIFCFKCMKIVLNC